MKELKKFKDLIFYSFKQNLLDSVKKELTSLNIEDSTQVIGLPNESEADMQHFLQMLPTQTNINETVNLINSQVDECKDFEDLKLYFNKRINDINKLNSPDNFAQFLTNISKEGSNLIINIQLSNVFNTYLPLLSQCEDILNKIGEDELLKDVSYEDVYYLLNSILEKSLEELTSQVYDNNSLDETFNSYCELLKNTKSWDEKLEIASKFSSHLSKEQIESLQSISQIPSPDESFIKNIVKIEIIVKKIKYLLSLSSKICNKLSENIK
ncbi:Hypothetical protein MYEA_2000 [Mycoplasma yeatsii 13926]|uniref:Uncharacterized protein n=1 Tax=Mycoplasma yeatsii 13926 TaxID=1188240 RepID=S6G401_9MOLU|nr:hypothetical protein [Mycoplasma yeatsii]EOA07402.1 Hypothetical protein MYEA_2000 [Mycoplasma yeatsii 13926]